MRQGRFGVLAIIVVAVLAALPMCTVGGGGGDNQLEVYSWWTGPGEEEGLAAMVDAFKKGNPGVEFVNAAVSGGAGSKKLQDLFVDAKVPRLERERAPIVATLDDRVVWVPGHAISADFAASGGEDGMILLKFTRLGGKS